MISREAALEIFARQFPDGRGAEEIRELDDGWYVPHSYIGSCGLVVDKRDGHVCEFGSAFPLEVWLWSYQRGFRWDSYDLVITGVRDLDAALRLLGHELGIAHPGQAHRPPRAILPTTLRSRLQSLPARFSNQVWWQSFNLLYQLRDDMPFDFAVEPDSHATVPPGARKVCVDATLLVSISDDSVLAGKLLALVDAGRLDVIATADEYWRASDVVHGSDEVTSTREERKALRERHRAHRGVFKRVVPCRLVDEIAGPRVADLAELRELVARFA